MQSGIDLFFMTKKYTSRTLMWLVGLLFATFISACSPSIDHHGYIARPGAFGQISEGMSKTEVEGILGSPSTTASVNFEGDSNYYISSVTQSRSFLQPKETSREVIAVRFDKNDQVKSFAQYGLEDGRIININSRQTPVVGDDLSVLQDIFKGILGSKPGF
jgi:outer membrane protein assembly factor BamE (lipoprotein component of BamABCDE complex)